MEKQVVEVVEKYIKSIHTQTKEDFDSVWSNQHNCSLISIKNVFTNRDEIFDHFYGLLGQIYSTIDLVNDGITVNMVNDELAIVIFKYHTECIRQDTNEPFGIEGLETQVIIKENNVWKLLHVHYSK